MSTPAFLQTDDEAKPPPWASKAAEVRTWLPPGARQPVPEPAEVTPPPELAQPDPGEGLDAETPEPVDGSSEPPPPQDAPEVAPETPQEPEDCPVCEETREEAAAERDELLDRLMDPYLAAAAELGRAADELRSAFNDDVVTLATRLASAILRREVAIDPAVLVANLDQAIAVAGPVTELTIRCHPDDAVRLREVAPGLAESASGRAVDVTVRPSPDVELGACLLLFQQGIVDARWTAQLDRLADAVRAAMARHPADVEAEAAAAGEATE